MECFYSWTVRTLPWVDIMHTPSKRNIEIACSCDPLVVRLSEEEFLRLAEVNIEALNTATADLPPEKVTGKTAL